MAKSERQKLLESGEARGILKPEHVAELAALRKKSGIAPGAKVAPKAQDITGLTDAGVRAQAAGDSIRLYNNIQPAIDRFNPGPMKGTLYDMVMPNDGGGIMDSIGSFVGAPVRALLPNQDKDDFQKIDAARAERISLRQKEQKGTQTDRDAVLYGRADIGPNKSRAVNHSLIDQNKTKSQLVKIQAALQSQWVGRYGSITQLSPNGMSFDQAVNMAQKDYLKNRPSARTAPPSTRRDDGWSVQEVK